MKTNTPQGHFCFDKSKQVAQKGAVATILLTIIIIAAAAVAIYMYMQKAETPVVPEGESISEVQFQDAVEN